MSIEGQDKFQSFSYPDRVSIKILDVDGSDKMVKFNPETREGGEEALQRYE